MKKIVSLLTLIALALALPFCLIGCGNTTDAEEMWKNALFTEDTEFGEGEKSITVEVKIPDHLVKFTIHTDKDTVGAALLEHGLISGEDSQFGLYLKSVNGITADFDVDKSYWAFYIDGEYAMSGVDTTEIREGVIYTLEYTR